MTKTEISKDTPLQTGDVVELHFKSVGMTWIQATQIAAIEYWCGLWHKEFTILSESVLDDNTIVFKIQVNKSNPVILTAAVIGSIIAGCGILAWLTLDKVYKIATEVLTSPAGKIAVGGLGSLATAAAIVLIIGLFKRK